MPDPKRAAPHRYVAAEPDRAERPTRREVLEETRSLLEHERAVIALDLRFIASSLEGATPGELAELSIRLRLIGLRLSCAALEMNHVQGVLREDAT